jgi:hypothetical protein
MSLVSLLVMIIVLGIVVWLIQSVIPLPPPFKTIALCIVGVIAVLWLLQGVGVLNTTSLRLN